MSDVLARIYAAKTARLAEEEAREPYALVRERGLARRGQRRPFLAALRAAAGSAIVAEIKRASPSAGLLAHNFDPVAIARAYDHARADAISVLTERDHFLGDLQYLEDVRGAVARPLLRKDFLWTRYHVAQSAAYGADALLLIAAGIDDEALRACLDEARAYDLDVLVEVHDEAEVSRVLAFGVELIGINNRDLRTLVTDLAVSEYLIPKVPRDVFVLAESGMRDAVDLQRLQAAGAGGFLIGEALMRAPDPGATIAALRGAAGGDAA